MDTNAFVFASCKGNEVSYELGEYGHGVFTYSVINNFRDISKSGITYKLPKAASKVSW